MRVWPGSPHPLGASWNGSVVNVAIHAGEATAVELCLFDEALDAAETARIALRDRTGSVWHAALPDLRPGQLYGFRVHGPFDPARGLRHDASKLLLDPCARAVTSGFRWHPALKARPDGAAPPPDSAPHVPKGVIVDESFDWQGDELPRRPWRETVICEAHVRGLTMRHPDVPPELRGRYLGVASAPVIAHLKSLGVTALELLPVHHFISEEGLVARGKLNYWGYNPLAFSAPHAGYASGDRGQQVDEFRRMVRALHREGLEVILDVVYNHTAEGNEHGPTLSLKGLDNPGYYRLPPARPEAYENWSGCGNALNAGSRRGLQLVLDSLRWWAQQMHVDGFRFDLAPVLGRDEHGRHTDLFWNALLADPLLSRRKLIVEPWDLGPDGWRSGSHPVGLAEWNGSWRDTVRRFWRGEPGLVGELAYRLAGSSDIYAGGPNASVNFVACHDGFTLADLTSYETKHNEDNGEENRDGTDANWSRNWGVEGETDDPAIAARRARIRRNLLATLAFSQGVAMFTAGDASGRTQQGNNNAYCQDGPLGWMDWDIVGERAELLAFARHVFALHGRHPVLRRRHFFKGRQAPRPGGHDVLWLAPDGREMGAPDWAATDGHVLGMLLPGASADERDAYGRPIPADTLLLYLNGGPEDVEITLPDRAGRGWAVLVDTAATGTDFGARELPARTERLPLERHALLLLRRLP